MILQNLMEEKQLDFNQPLLSVRRFSSTATSETDNKRKTDNSLARLPPLPAYKSELKSGPVRNPGTVPFVWEQTPGRPKDENQLQTQVVERSPIPIAPNLPPGRFMKGKQKDSDEVSKGTSVTHSKTASAVSNSKSVTSINKDMSNSQSVTSTKKDVRKYESPREIAMQGKASSVSDDGDEAYHDALDTLSRTESFFMNCSVSGLSGLDDQMVHLSRSFSQDQFARDFMMDRFLPAAQAVASETPQYASRKPPVPREQPRQVRMVLGVEKSRPLNQHRPNTLPPYAQELVREESEDEGDLYNESEDYAGKVCGLLPRFCLLSPIPGLKMQDRVLSSSVHGMQAKSSASDTETGRENAKTAYFEKKSADSQSGFTKEKYLKDNPVKSKNDIDQHRRGCSTLPPSERTQYDTGCRSPVVEKTLYVDSVQKVKSHSGSNSSDMKVQINHKRDDFETLRKDNKLLDIADEKATIQSKGSESLNLSLLPLSDRSINKQTGMTNLSKRTYSEKQGSAKSGKPGRDFDQNLSPKVAECKKLDSAGNQESFHGQIQTSVSCVEDDVNRQEATKSVDQGLNQDPSKFASSKVVGDGKIDLESQGPMKLSNKAKSDKTNLQLVLALPLPKAPSESWLKRTLPIISSRNVSSKSYPATHIHGRGQNPKAAFVGPKWETIVKSSNLHHGHLRFSEELLAPIPEA